MQEVDYNQPIEVFHAADNRVVPASVSPDWGGAGSPPIWTQGALFAVSANMLARMGWHVRNVGA